MKVISKMVSFLKGASKGVGLDDLVPAVVAFVVIAIIGAIGALILQNFQTNSSVPVNSVAYNSIGFGISAVSTIMSFLPLLGLVIIAAAIISVVLLAFAFGARGRGTERY
ncbi:MAG: hypothetical protein KGH64_00775 [Candidatus Micrarchaeota archaeon]|nr:hypothetical protein [Candidatus Micrarchaeota archaeon]